MASHTQTIHGDWASHEVSRSRERPGEKQGYPVNGLQPVNGVTWAIRVSLLSSTPASRFQAIHESRVTAINSLIPLYGMYMYPYMGEL